MASIEDIIGSATLREETTTICVAGDLNAEHERLTAELARLDEQEWQPSSLGGMGEDPRRVLAGQVTAVEARMSEHEHTFRFRAMPWRRFREMREKYTPDSGSLDLDGLVPQLMLVCCVEPKFADAAQVDKLLDVLTSGQVDALFTAAWKANVGDADVPKSARASALMASSAPRWKSPAEQAYL
jgi:hypothetical protein